ncbi:3-hydroxyacyl-CoA dehydrogenase involved in xenocoumacin synthesis [Thermobacillus xylanilyticus]|jgi:3-hydroxybutyryl-CoA dehydrogenase|uniref:3-hydroxyacyl-CoA dehydrogenase involved in xenocoumacin synthesis n=1 Tax=Thermobacillus xylanilyticus TaxID=76633 RepID=A0ABM8V4Q6_THEXY|nr:3-hydroxyacyl-CoA dehydrogenase family protein [Thermobacillus xylanilyticus]CAG5087367.1 3-hydroxyacyl-CoA dehydrogenase involved in xenocoumacin synthesis [Thermobacillus xylanilyticus]
MIQRVAIIGAGVMGCATALDVAKHGYSVILKDISSAAAEQAVPNIRREYRTACMLNPEYRKVELSDILDRIQVRLDYDGIGEADLIIENISENAELKMEEYVRLVKHCKHDALFALNTSCISITKLAAGIPDPSRVIGIHLMNPVPLKSMVEVIRGWHTSRETEERVVQFLETLGKKPIVINDLPGFVTNRLSHLFMNEAAFLVQDGVASPEQIDKIIKHGFGHKMGPLETADLIGLDTVVHSLDVLYESYQDPKFRCCPLLRKMVDAGLLGRKSGRGFYQY